MDEGIDLKKLLFWMFGIALAIILFFSDNIWGFYRFKSICAEQGGLRVAEPLERNVGWMVKAGHVTYVEFPVGIPSVAFVRYRNERDGILYDVYKTQREKISEVGYEQRLADVRNPVIYEYRWSRHALRNEIRMSSVLREVIDLRSGKVVSTYRTFSYSEFEPSRTPLAAPSGVTCPDDPPRIDEKTGKTLPSLLSLAFYQMFKN